MAEFGKMDLSFAAAELDLAEEGERRVYFVVETKGGGNNGIRVSDAEKTKIRCARRHFEAIDAGVEYGVRTQVPHGGRAVRTIGPPAAPLICYATRRCVAPCLAITVRR